jgi:hypothetical protein
MKNMYGFMMAWLPEIYASIMVYLMIWTMTIWKNMMTQNLLLLFMLKTCNLAPGSKIRVEEEGREGGRREKGRLKNLASVDLLLLCPILWRSKVELVAWLVTALSGGIVANYIVTS